MKEFLRWMQGGLAGLGQALIQIATGGHVSLRLIGSAMLVAFLVRGAGWLVWKYGPMES